MTLYKTRFIQYAEDLLGDVEAVVRDEGTNRDSVFLTFESDLVQMGEVSPSEFEAAFRRLEDMTPRELSTFGIGELTLVKRDPRLGIFTVQLLQQGRKATKKKAAVTEESLMTLIDSSGVNSTSYDSPLLVLRSLIKTLSKVGLGLQAANIKKFEEGCFDAKTQTFKRAYKQTFSTGQFNITLNTFQLSNQLSNAKFDAVVSVSLNNKVSYVKKADKYDSIDFTPPKAVRDNAERGLELRRKQSPSNKGGLSVQEAAEQGVGSGVQRAVNLKNGDPVSPDVAKRMKGFFARFKGHISDARKLKSEEEQLKSKMYVSDLIWGGKEGEEWANKLVQQMEEIDNKKEASVMNKKASSVVGKNIGEYVRDNFPDIEAQYIKYVGDSVRQNIADIFSAILKKQAQKLDKKFIKPLSYETIDAYGSNSSIVAEVVSEISLNIPFNAFEVVTKALKVELSEHRTEYDLNVLEFENFLASQNLKSYFDEVVRSIDYKDTYLAYVLAEYVEQNLIGPADVEYDEDEYNEMPEDYTISISALTSTAKLAFVFKGKDPRGAICQYRVQLTPEVNFE